MNADFAFTAGDSEDMIYICNSSNSGWNTKVLSEQMPSVQRNVPFIYYMLNEESLFLLWQRKEVKDWPQIVLA